MKYTKASAEVVLFDNSDVITTSGIDWSDPNAAMQECKLPSLSQSGVCTTLTWN